MRQYFLSNGSVRKLIDFGDSPIFESATTYTEITLWSKEPGKKPEVWDLTKAYEACSSLAELLDRQGQGEALFTPESFVLTWGDEARIKKRIEEVGKPLRDWDISIYRGILTGLNEAFIIDKKKYDELVATDPRSAEILKPILRGRDIKRYRAEWAGLYLIAMFPALHLDIDQYPAIRDYLKTFGKALEQSGERGSRKKTNNKWFEVQDTIAYWKEFEKEKIIYPNMTKYCPFVVEDANFLTNQKCFILTSEKESLRYLAAILNSWVFDFAYRPSLFQNSRND